MTKNCLYPKQQYLAYPEEIEQHLATQESREALFKYELFIFAPDATPEFVGWWDRIKSKLFSRTLSEVQAGFDFLPKKSVAAPSPSVGLKQKLRSSGTIALSAPYVV